jgi:hypothetical protein
MAGGRAATIRCAHHRAQGEVAEPVATPFIAQHVSQPPDRAARPVASRPYAIDPVPATTTVPGAAGNAGFERDQCVIDDENLARVTDALENLADGRGCLPGRSTPRHAQADGPWLRMIAQRPAESQS